MNPTDPSTHDTTTPTPTGPTSTTSTDDNPYDLLAQDHDEGAWVREAALAHAAKHHDQTRQDLLSERSRLTVGAPNE